MLKTYHYDVAKLNEIHNIQEFTNSEEDKYFDQIKSIASNIVRYNKKIILLSGPSASGKTTSSFLLQRELSKLGVSSHVLNMDEFFYDIDTIPVVDGKPDIENLCALDVDTIKKCLGEIIDTGKTMTPQFDFATHKRKKEWVEVDVPSNEVVLMEGIHALNPAITEGLDDGKIYKVYVHCSVQFLLGEDILLSSEDIRLIRRLVRDDRDRGTPPEQTVEMWADVLKGEKRNITPYIEYAHAHLNTAHAYEPMLYKDIFDDIMVRDSEHSGKEYYAVLRKLQQELLPFSSLPTSTISPNSVIREFVGRE